MNNINTKHLAKLSKLALEEQELNEIASDMAAIMNLMDTLQEVELPFEEIPRTSVVLSKLRKDEIMLRIDPLELTHMSPSQDGFTIPKLME